MGHPNGLLEPLPRFSTSGIRNESSRARAGVPAPEYLCPISVASSDPTGTEPNHEKMELNLNDRGFRLSVTACIIIVVAIKAMESKSGSGRSSGEMGKKQEAYLQMSVACARSLSLPSRVLIVSGGACGGKKTRLLRPA